MAPSGLSSAGDGRAHRGTKPGPPYQLTACTGRPREHVRRRPGGVPARLVPCRIHEPRRADRTGRPQPGGRGGGTPPGVPRPGHAGRGLHDGTCLRDLRSGRAMHRGRTLSGAYPALEARLPDDPPRPRPGRGPTRSQLHGRRARDVGRPRDPRGPLRRRVVVPQRQRGRDPGPVHGRRPDRRVARRVVRVDGPSGAQHAPDRPDPPDDRRRTGLPPRHLNGESHQTIIDWTPAGGDAVYVVVAADASAAAIEEATKAFPTDH